MNTPVINSSQTHLQETTLQNQIVQQPSTSNPMTVIKTSQQGPSDEVVLKKNQSCFNPVLEGTLKAFAGIGCAVIFTAFLPVLGVPALVGACMMLSDSENENELALMKEKKSRGLPVSESRITELEEKIENNPMQNIGFFLAFFPATALTCLHDVYNQIMDATL